MCQEHMLSGEEMIPSHIFSNQSLLNKKKNESKKLQQHKASLIEHQDMDRNTFRTAV